MSAFPGLFGALAQHLGAALLPLDRAFRDPDEFRALMLQLGWSVSGLPGAYAALADTASAASDAAAGLGDEPGLDDVVAVIEAVGAAYDALLAIHDAPAGVDRTAYLAEIGPRVFERLLVDHLALDAPSVHAGLRGLGVIVDERHDATATRPAYTRSRFDWAALPGTLGDPASIPARSFGWGTAAFDAGQAIEVVDGIFAGLGMGTSLDQVGSDFATGIQAQAAAAPERPIHLGLTIPFFETRIAGSYADTGISVMELPAEGADPPGLMVRPAIPSGVATTVDVGGGWTFAVRAGTDLSDELGILLRPGGATVRYPFAAGQPFPAAGMGFTLEYEGDEPTILVGDPGGTHLELDRATIAADLDGAAGGVELRLSLALDGLAVVITGSGSDAFLSSALAGAGSRVEVAFGIAWSSETGLDLLDQAGIAVSFSPGLDLTVIRVDRVDLALQLVTQPAPSSAIRAQAVLSGTVGPFSYSIDGLGIELPVVFTDGNAGPFDIALRVVPPTGIGLGIDASVASGGGFLWLDDDAGEYAGVFDLQLLSIGISAVGLVETKLPDGGWSMFLALFIDVPAIPLGFGFTLNGVGGLVGVNRTLDTAALQDAVRAGSLDAVLFPEDPIADAPLTIDTLRAIFPSSPGQYVFGPVVKIGWGSPLTLIEAELGIVIALPDPIVIAVLGSISSVLPEEDVDLIALHLDVAGIIDTGVPSLSIDASLHDSHVVGFALSGDMALRASFGSEPVFLMALGGFHPGFDAPPGFPALDRLSLAVDAGDLLDIRFDCYLALTSNTLQFGAAFEVSAEVEGFGISGGAEFDALITFSPFHLVTHVGYHVSVTAVGVDLMGVWLDASLEGPNPWRATGTASFKVLGLEQHVDLDVTVGSKKPEPAPPPDDVLDALATALALPDAWSIGAGGGAGVVLSDGGTAAGELVVAPDGGVGVTQRVVPLALTIDRAPPHTIAGGYDWFDLEVPAESLAASGEMTDWFAPSSYVDLSPSEYLAAPSFERLRSGLEVGGGDPSAGTARAFTLAYEEIIRDPGVGDDRGDLVFDYAIDGRAGEILGAAMAGGISSRLAGGTLAAAAGGYAVDAADAGTTVLLQKPGFVARDRLTGAVLAEGASWAGARTSVAGRDAGSVVAPAWEVTA